VDQRPVFIQKRLEANPVADSREADKTCQNVQVSSRDFGLPFSLLSTRNVPVLVLLDDACRDKPATLKTLELS
jgi:hypothetical protein